MDAVTIIKTWFPNISNGWRLTSPVNGNYNCISWAANQDDSRFWWPDEDGYWPISKADGPTLTNFLNAFATLGYRVITPNHIDFNIHKKLVIYQNQTDATVTHMSCELDIGVWSSKLGRSWDVSHLTPGCLNGVHYGVATTYLAMY